MVLYLYEHGEKQKNLSEDAIVEIILRQSLEDILAGKLVSFKSKVNDSSLTLKMLQEHTSEPLCIVASGYHQETVPEAYVDAYHSDIGNKMVDSCTGRVYCKIRYYEYTVATKALEEQMEEHLVNVVYPKQLNKLKSKLALLSKEQDKVQKQISSIEETLKKYKERKMTT